jgi:hypothetical protein
MQAAVLVGVIKVGQQEQHHLVVELQDLTNKEPMAQPTEVAAVVVVGLRIHMFMVVVLVVQVL